MKYFKIKRCQQAICKAIVCGALLSSYPVNIAQAGIPVIDAGNLQTNILQTIESIGQTLKQIQEYKTQLQQYENQIQNTLAPAAYIWDRAQSTINELMTAVDTIEYYRQRSGSIEQYLAKFQDVAYYRSSPCFSKNGCTEAEWQAMKENERLASEAQKKANDALTKGIDQQQKTLKQDARRLERLQRAAQGANGQMEAIQYGSQIASQQTNQLLQIRGLLLTQQNAVAARTQAVLDVEAKSQAASDNFRRSNYRPSPERSW